MNKNRCRPDAGFSSTARMLDSGLFGDNPPLEEVGRVEEGVDFPRFRQFLKFGGAIM